MDFSTLCGPKGVPGSVADILNNSLIAPSVPYFIQEAESLIYRRLRHWRMLSAPTTATMTPGTSTLTLPSDFLDPYMLYLTSSSGVPGYGPMLIKLATPEQVIARYSYNGASRNQMTPTMYYFDGNAINLDNVPDLAYPYSLIYYQQPAPLTTLNITNWVTQYYPRLFRAAVMAQAVEWTKESGSGQFDRTYWFGIVEAEIEKAQEESDLSRRSASASSGMVAF